MKELLYHDFVEKLKRKEYVSGTYQIFMESKDSFAQIAALLEEGNYHSYEMKIYQERDGKRITCIFPNEMIELSVQEPQVAYSTKRTIPIGVSDYRKLKEKNYYCIDKTRMIEELLQINAEATLITRPRRFGKTTNMNMLSEFFDISKQSQDLFKDTYIAKTEYVSQMNQWPVIFLSFRDAKGNKTRIIKNIKERIIMEFDRHACALESMPKGDQILCSRIYKTFEDQSDQSLEGMNTAILFLSKKLHDYYNKPVIILVDEYDTPFLEAYVNHCYEELRYDLSTLLSSALKDNEYLNFAVMTGIQRIAKENVFSGLNNLEICTIQDDQYADIFGFTEEETMALLSFYGRTFDTKVKDMYDGYTIGNYEIYNPWSILKYAKLGKLDAYWIHTASNQIIKDLMRFHDENFMIKYDELITTGETIIQTDLSESYVYGDSSGIWSLLIHAGYVTIIESLEEGTYHIRIVNQEIRQDFISITTYGLGINRLSISDMLKALCEGKTEDFVCRYKEILVELVSYHDVRSENSYHMLMLGMCSYLYRDYIIESNRETGEGRADIYLKSKTGGQDIIMEFKHAKNKQIDLKELAQTALDQIKERGYAMRDNTLLLGMAHSGKNCEIIYEQIGK